LSGQADGAVSIFAGRERQAAVLFSALIALKLLLLFVYAWNSRIVMDEFGQLGYAKYLGNGLFDTVQPPKAVGFAVFYKLAHLIGWDAQSIVLAGRFQTALMACATLAMIHACARSLGADRVGALAVILILLCFSNFIEQIFRTRAEQLAVFFAAAALLVLLRGRADRPGVGIAAGLLSGLAFLATQKSIYFNVALGIALVAEAAIARRYLAGVTRGAWLVLGWLVPIIVYCLAFGGTDPAPIARSLVFGPVEVATRGGAEYGGLRDFVAQTLLRNAVLYFFCFAGLVLGMVGIRSSSEGARIALIFSAIITALVFAHDQPWPYVFVMALPFLALWSLTLLDRLAANPHHVRLAWIALSIALATSFVRNVRYLEYDNAAQLELVARAEALIGPDEIYFDGIGMLPNRPEPTTLWLDRKYVLATLREGQASEAFQVLTRTAPKIILWSYRLDAIHPVIAPAVQHSYVRVAPNLRIAGRDLIAGRRATFKVPVAGRYALYTRVGAPLQGQVEVDGQMLTAPFQLAAGTRTLALLSGPSRALLLPEGSYRGILKPGDDNDALFANVYD
jgi:hypothetical protein